MSKWTEMKTIEQWKQGFEQSETRPIVILKHSTTCPVSRNALHEYEAYLNDNTADVDFYLVKVIESRPVSNQIAEDLKLRHESPQIIYIENKEKVWSATHWAITDEHIKAVLN